MLVKDIYAEYIRFSKKKAFEKSDLDGVLRQVELSGQLAPLGPGDVIFPDKLLLQPADLVPGEGCPISPDVVVL